MTKKTRNVALKNNRNVDKSKMPQIFEAFFYVFFLPRIPRISTNYFSTKYIKHFELVLIRGIRGKKTI